MKIWQNILTKLQENQKVYLLTVIENSGSSPGRKGFKMLVAEDGFIFGSVGGGIMEFSLVEEVKTLLSKEKNPIFLKKQIHRGKIKDGSGMICSGKQTIVFHPLNKKDVPVIKEIISSLKNNKTGSIHFSPTSFSFTNKLINDKFEYKIESNTDWFFNEQINYKETLYIIGGGHVGLAVSEIFIKLGFYVIVFDNRENLNTLENNNFAHEKLVINYHLINNYITESKNNYIAIMTNTYTDDKLLLSKLIKDKSAFLGVLGSKAKLQTMWEVLLKENFTQEELNSVYAPIGLNIKSESPEEIAISIAAQVIQLRNKKKATN